MIGSFVGYLSHIKNVSISDIMSSGEFKFNVWYGPGDRTILTPVLHTCGMVTIPCSPQRFIHLVWWPYHAHPSANSCVWYSDGTILTPALYTYGVVTVPYSPSTSYMWYSDSTILTPVLIHAYGAVTVPYSPQHFMRMVRWQYHTRPALHACGTVTVPYAYCSTSQRQQFTILRIVLS
jgi:hypothetical protein